MLRQRRARIVSAWSAPPAAAACARRWPPATPRHSRFLLGSRDHARDRTPPLTMATLTVNSSRPAMNSLVPSSGSTRMKLPPSAGGAVCRTFPRTPPARPAIAAPILAGLNRFGCLVRDRDRRLIVLSAGATRSGRISRIARRGAGQMTVNWSSSAAACAGRIPAVDGRPRFLMS